VTFTCGQRISVVGTAGSGKTTVAREIARRLELPHVELDALFWEPDWTEAAPDVFRDRVALALSGARWVADGNYSKARDIVWGRADTVVWLDYAFAVSMGQLVWRTARRCLTHEELWSGNRESWRKAFCSRESILVWAMQTRGKGRRNYPVLLSSPAHAHLALIRLRSPRQTRAWLASLQPAQH
jgi:adenylate kinase family enzyme